MDTKIRQYIDLYCTEWERINAHSCDTLNARRPEAFENIEDDIADDLRKSELDALALDYGLNITRIPFCSGDDAAFRCPVPGITAHTAYCIDDKYSVAAPDKLPDGVTFKPMSHFYDTDLLNRYYGTAASTLYPAEILNTLFVQDAMVLHVAAGVKVDDLFQLISAFSAPVDMMSPRRMLIIMERGSSARLLLCDHASRNDHSYLSLPVIEAFLEPDSELEVYDIDESGSTASRISTFYAQQAAGSSFRAVVMNIGGGLSSNEFKIKLDGAGAQTSINGMVVAEGTREVSYGTLLLHESRDTKSDQLFKYIVDDKAVGRFCGLVRVAPGAVGTEARQANRNILASRDARMYGRPSLEIYCDDVKCSHGATTGQLDSEALFYMQTRGIPLDEARRMLMQAFFTDVVANVRPAALRERLTRLVADRFEQTREADNCGVCRSADGCRLRHESN